MLVSDLIREQHAMITSAAHLSLRIAPWNGLSRSHRLHHGRLCRITLALLHLFLYVGQCLYSTVASAIATYQRPHSAVQRMSVVSPELRIGAFERRVSVRLGLLDTVRQWNR